MSLKKKLATALTTCATVLAMGATAALADSTVTYNYTFPDATTNWSTVITIPRFNTSLGTLSSIDFALAGELLGTAMGQNSDGGSVTASLSGGLYIPELGVSTTGTTGGSGTGNTPFSFPTTSLPPTSGSSGAPPGTSDVTLTVQGSSSCILSTPGNCTGEVGGTGTFSATYVPEPASLALLGLGFAALGAGTRRRRS